jgi:HAD superfamily hydrolase (TIGR01549 family)
MAHIVKLDIRGRTQITCKLAVFDLDDTLIGTRQLAYRKIRRLAKVLNLPVPKWNSFEQAYKTISYPKYIEEVLHSGLSLEKIEKFYNQVHESAGGYKLLSGVLDLLFQMQQAKLPVGILSNAVASRIPEKIAEIDSYITDIWCCGEEIPAKPNPECLLPMFQSYPDIRHQEIVSIGDNIKDFLTVKDTSIRFIAVQTGVTNRQEFEDAGVHKDQIISDLTELKVVRAYS